MKADLREFFVSNKHGNELSVSLLENSDVVTKEKRILIIGSATGIKKKFYSQIAHYFSTHGFTVVLFDYYGIGDSLQTSIKKVKSNMFDWGDADLQAIVDWSLEKYPTSKLHYLAHSFGGQVVGLLRDPNVFTSSIFIACQTGYLGHYPKKFTIPMWFLWKPLTYLLGYLPNKRLGAGENLPKQVSLQLLRWSKMKNYFFDDERIDVSRYPLYKNKILWIRFTDDSWAPEGAVKDLMKQYTGAKITEKVIDPRDVGKEKIGHFSYFKESNKDLWDELPLFFN